VVVVEDAGGAVVATGAVVVVVGALVVGGTVEVLTGELVVVVDRDLVVVVEAFGELEHAASRHPQSVHSPSARPPCTSCRRRSQNPTGVRS
jgi:hypothetical protein